MHKSSIMDIHPNNTMESRNATLFEDVFSFNEAQENYSLYKLLKARSSNHHQLEDGEVKHKRSKKEKITKIFCIYFLTYLL